LAGATAQHGLAFGSRIAVGQLPAADVRGFRLAARRQRAPVDHMVTVNCALGLGFTRASAIAGFGLLLGTRLGRCDVVCCHAMTCHGR